MSLRSLSNKDFCEGLLDNTQNHAPRESRQIKYIKIK